MYSFFFSSRRRHTRSLRDWSSDVCSSDLRASTFLPCWARTAHRSRLPTAGLRQSPTPSKTISFRSACTDIPLAREVVVGSRSEEHTSELQSRRDLVCRLLLEKKKISRDLA